MSATDTTTAEGILRLGNSFCDAKALLTGVELGLFTLLAKEPADAGQIRERLELNGRGLSDWLDLLVELGLVERDDRGRYRNAPGAERFLVPGRGPYLGGFLQRTNHNLYPAWGSLGTALRTGEPQSGSSFEAVLRDPAILGKFVGSMDSLVSVLGPQLLEAYHGWSDHTTVLDVGGCRGALLGHVLRAHPHLTGEVFDLPEMAPFAAELAKEQGLTDRLTFHGGDFFTDPLPTADLVIMGHVLHDWDADQRRQLLHAAARSVNPGGTLLVYDRILDRASSRVENLVISLDMLLVTDGGSEYTLAELAGNARDAGLGAVEDQPLGAYDTLVVCRAP